MEPLSFPIWGINMVGWEFDFSKEFQKNTISSLEETSVSKPCEFVIQMSAGASQPYFYPEKRYPFYHLGIYSTKRLGTFSRLIFGADGFYNLGVKEEIRAHFILRNQEDLPDFKRLGIVMGHELWMDKLALSIMLGRYIYELFPAFKSFYQRYGLKYRLVENIHVQVV